MREKPLHRLQDGNTGLKIWRDLDIQFREQRKDPSINKQTENEMNHN